MIRIFFIAVLLSAVAHARSQDTSLMFRHHVALRLSEGPAVLRQCSRGTPQHVTGFWEVSLDTIALLEQNLWRIRHPFGDSARKPTTHADSVTYFHRFDGNQYIGVIIGGQRYVYINHLGNELSEDCMTKACDVCDGGFYFWGALFNVATLEFSEVQFNGFA